MSQSEQPAERVARFEQIFRAYYPTVFGYIARRTDADTIDDLVDEVFLVAWRRLDKVPEEPVAWLLRVARNVLGTHIRGARRNRALSVRLAANEVDNLPSGESFSAREIKAAFAALSPKDREALALVDWDGLTPAQAAVTCGQPGPAFRVRLHRARTRFRKALEHPDSEAGAEVHTKRPVPKEVPNV